MAQGQQRCCTARGLAGRPHSGEGRSAASMRSAGHQQLAGRRAHLDVEARARARHRARVGALAAALRVERGGLQHQAHSGARGHLGRGLHVAVLAAGRSAGQGARLNRLEVADGQVLRVAGGNRRSEAPRPDVPASQGPPASSDLAASLPAQFAAAPTARGSPQDRQHLGGHVGLRVLGLVVGQRHAAAQAQEGGWGRSSNHETGACKSMGQGPPRSRCGMRPGAPRRGALQRRTCPAGAPSRRPGT